MVLLCAMCPIHDLESLEGASSMAAHTSSLNASYKVIFTVSFVLSFVPRIQTEVHNF